MKDNDTYPPSADVKSGTLQMDNLAQEIVEDSEEDNSESDDVRLSEPEEENEIVADDELEEYEEENTGIKIKYTLSPEEVYGVVTRSGDFKDTLKMQQRHTLLQSAVLGIMIAIAFFLRNPNYLWFAVLPIVTVVLVWLVPFLGMRKIVSNTFYNKPITLEVFPDKIDFTQNGVHREIILDNSYESEEFDNTIVITKGDIISLILPLRAVESDFRAEVQAIILAGIKPKDEE